MLCLVSIMPDFVTAWTVVCHAPLSMGILQARILVWVAMPSSMGSSQPRDWTYVSHITGEFFAIWATKNPGVGSLFFLQGNFPTQESNQDLMHSVQFGSVQSLSHVRLFVTPWITARQASLSITNSWSSLRLKSIKSVMPSSHLILRRPLLLLPSIPPSIRVFSNELTLLMRWQKYWSISFNISPSNEHPGLISFRMDWLDLLAVQGALKRLFQHHSSKESILWRSTFSHSNSHIHTWPVEKP